MHIKNIKNEKGQAMVEFALILPILLMLIGGIMDFGWVFSNILIANNASREAARYAAIHKYDTDYTDIAVINQAKARIPDFIESKINADGITLEEVTINGDKAIKFTVKWNIDVFMPFYSRLINPFNVVGETVMKIEGSSP